MRIRKVKTEPIKNTCINAFICNDNNNNNDYNNAFYLKAFKALKDTAHKNNSTTKTGDNLVQMRINE